MRPVIVVVARELAKHECGMPLVDDQHSVEEFAADAADERSAIALARGARTGVLMMPTSMAAKTASKAAVNLASRSRTPPELADPAGGR